MTTTYQYKYEHEGQRVYLTSTSEVFADLFGSINGNAMTITNTSNGQVIGVLIRQ